MTEWATKRPPHVRGTAAQRVALLRAANALGLRDCTAATLEALIRRADGAGFAYPSSEVLVRDCGCVERSVRRALSRLVQAGHVERFRFLGRRGEGVPIYRLGRALRVAAGLREVADVRAHLGLVERPVRPSDEPPVRPSREVVPVLPPVRPSESPESPAREGRTPSRPVLPLNVGTKDQAGDEVRFVPSRSEGTSDDERRQTDALLALAAAAGDVEPPSPFVSPLDPEEALMPDDVPAPAMSPTLDDALLDPALFAQHVAPYVERCALCAERVGTRRATLHGATLIVCDECASTPALTSAQRAEQEVVSAN